ncbi:MAG: FAD-binding protein [Deltaproteobacteria bacterium]|nr:FAD-binding protein [Deltaproteobacteria bacterium]
MSELAKALKGKLQGEVRVDPMTRQVYSTDASMYEIEPEGVVVPRGTDDIEAAMEVARDMGIPVVGRGGGTSLAGQVVTNGLILDFSTHLNRVIELNLEERWVKVEPGVVQNQLNRFLAPHGFLFGPDTATSSRATMGGMAGNNSAGARSILYGKTVDHVLEMDVILSDGSRTLLSHITEDEARQRARQETLEGAIYRDMLAVAHDSRDDVNRRFPKIMRRVSGYNLDELMKGPGLNLSGVVVGSEGTLAMTTALKLNIVPMPKVKGLLVVHFHDMVEAVMSNQEVLKHKPSATELIDASIISEALTSPAMRGQTGFIEGRPDSLLVVEFYADNKKELLDKIDKLETGLKKNNMGYAWVRALEAADQNKVWNFRQSGLGLMMGHRMEAKPVAFVEDTAVDPVKLPDYLKEFLALMKKHGTTAGFYGHSSVGCMHIRPFLDLKKPEQVQKMMVIFNDVTELVQKYGGSLSGEHGDGLARSWLNERLFGPEVYQAFKKVKAAWDPHNRLNPGKVVDAPAPTENLRYAALAASHPDKPRIDTVFDFSREGGFQFAVEMCNGNAQCRKMEGVMCPSFQATLDDRHSTRGRANAFRGLITGKLGPKAMTSHRMYQVLDLCLQCKGCKRECPSQVDMAKLKSEFLSHYYQAHGVPLRNRLFGSVGLWGRLGSATAPFSNWAASNPVSRLGLRLIGITTRRSLPAYTRRRFSSWFYRHTRNQNAQDKPKVVLFHDTYMEYHYPRLGKAAVAILEHAGYQVLLIPKKCCGRPLISKGMLHKAKKNARHNVAQLIGYAQEGVPIVGVEPSCILTLRDEYRDLVPGKESQTVADHVFTMDEFMKKLVDKGKLKFKPSPGGVERDAMLHGHCMQKALSGTADTLAVLKAIPGLVPKEIDSGCCGVAGSFGYEHEHYELSVAIGEQRLLPAVRRAKPDAELVANGVSCRQQISHRTPRKAKHIVEVVAEALEGAPRL